MEDAEDSKPIVDAAREVNTLTPEACVAVSKARAPLKTVNDRRGSNQPRTAWMVNSAILALNELRGSSIQAIKRYMAANYNIDTKKKALFIKKYLISAVNAGVLHRTSGSGANGSFKVRKFNPPNQKPEAATKKAVTEQKPEAATKKAVAEKTAVAAKTPIAADKNLAKAFKKQTTADKKLAEVVKKKIAADKKLAEAVKRQAAADKKLAGVMKKLAAADYRAAAQKAASSVVSGKNVNKESAADPPNAKTTTSQ